MSKEFDDPGPISIDGHQAKMSGIVRDVSFRMKGSSITFRGDFYISEMLDGLQDILFGWRFMCDEATEILDKVHRVYQSAKSFVGRAASAATEKTTHFASELYRQGSSLLSRAPSPSPPYSLFDVFDRDFVDIPRLL